MKFDFVRGPMIVDEALLLPFRSQNGYYFYDAKSNEVLRVDRDAFQEVLDVISSNTLDGGQTTIDHLPPSVRALAERGYLDPAGFSSMSHGLCASCLRRRMDAELTQVTLEVTSRCNLRCSYCIYSRATAGNRVHGNEMMSLETALAGVRYLAEHSKEAPHRAVGFYGGEPFLNFPVMVAAAKEARLLMGDAVFFTVTTNATLLTAEILSWCIQQGASLVFSLDGPEGSHDRNRRSICGKGTWSRVVDGLRRLKGMAPDYFESKVSVNAVLCDNTSPKELGEFFSTLDCLPHRYGAVRVSLESAPMGMAEGWEVKRFHAELAECQQTFIHGVIRGELQEPEYRVARALFEGPILRLYKRGVLPTGYKARLSPNGMCVPGVRKLFITCSGDLYSCERVNRRYSIGNIHSGFCHEMALGILEAYAEASLERCRRCWACRLCGTCLAAMADEDGILMGKALERCKSTRRRVHNDLVVFASILESRPDGLDYMEGISIS